MATLYLDFEGGNDANNGSSFANRFKTLESGATAARTAPGDIIRCMSTPLPVSLGVNGTFTEGSATVTLSAAVTQEITDCDSAWTASANVTCSTDSSNRKEGTNSASINIGAPFTTGLVAYFATGTLDLSAFQAISFWVRNNSAGWAASVLKLCLCSDTAGATPVDTFVFPEVRPVNRWTPMVLDKGSALGSSIQSIALYADSDPGTYTILLDNIFACESPGTTGALNLTSLIGKVSCLARRPSTAYTAGDRRRAPTGTGRMGYLYECTSSGTSDSGDITWPNQVGAYVDDGTAEWYCIGLEEVWWPVQSVVGTTVLLDVGINGSGVNSTPASTNRGYAGETETVAAYSRDVAYLVSNLFGSGIGLPQEAGSVAGGQITYSGGWNRTDMTTQDPDGETWATGISGNMFIAGGSRAYLTFENFGITRHESHDFSGIRGLRFRNVFVTCNGSQCLYLSSTNTQHQVWEGGAFYANYCLQGNISLLDVMSISLRALSLLSGYSGGALTIGQSNLSHPVMRLRMRDLVCRNSAGYGLNHNGGARPITVEGSFLAAGNTSGSVNCQGGEITLIRPVMDDTTEINFYTTNQTGSRVRCHDYDSSPGDHRHFFPSANIVTDTAETEPASGSSWRFNPGSTIYDRVYPLTLALGKVLVASGSLVTISVWARRDSTNINGRMYLRGGDVAGDNEIEVAMGPSINTWTQYTMTFTPTEAGVVEIMVDVWDGVGTTNKYWVDTLEVTQ